jgi:TRAP-type C4-dicarboxylate transport system substrate-binding protein
MNLTLFISIFLISIQACFGSTTVWKIQSHKLSNSLLHQNFNKYVVEPINKELKGKLQIELYSQDTTEILHENVSSFSAVRSGNIDGMFSATMYWGNIDPVFAIFGDLIAAWPSTLDFNNWYDETGAEQLISKTYQKYNMKFLGYSLTSHESLVSNIPINNIKSFKNKIIRTPHGSMGNKFFVKVRANVRPMGMSKVMGSLTQGAIHMADFSTIGVNLREGLYKSAKHTNYPGFHSLPVLDFVVNNNRWNELSEECKQIILKYVMKWKQQNITSILVADKLALKKLKAHGVNIYTWSKNDLKEARIIASSIWHEFASKSKDANSLVSSIKAWLKKNDKL